MTSLDFGPVAQVRRTGLDVHPMRIGRSARKLLLASDPEALINIGRLVTALFAVLAIYLDPTDPASFLVQSQVVLGLYMVLSLLLVVFPLRKPLDSPVHFLVHIIDAIILGCLAFLTDELTSPFFSFLPFILLAMTLRWGLRGAVMGAVELGDRPSGRRGRRYHRRPAGAGRQLAVTVTALRTRSVTSSGVGQSV